MSKLNKSFLWLKANIFLGRTLRCLKLSLDAAYILEPTMIIRGITFATLISQLEKNVKENAADTNHKYSNKRKSQCPKMTNKTDMIKRQTELLDKLNNNTFDKTEFLTKHKILDRTLRRDLNSLAERGEIFEERVAYLRKKCLGNLTQKAHTGKLSDTLMYNIVMSGITQKQEITTDLSVDINKKTEWQIDPNYIKAIEDCKKVLEAIKDAAIQNGSLPSNTLPEE